MRSIPAASQPMIEARPAVNREVSARKDLTAPRPVARSGVPVTGV